MEHVLLGKTNNEIAEALFITSHTVKAHLESIFLKLDVHNKIQAIIKCIELGIVKI